MGARYGSFDVFGVTGEVLVPYRLLTSSRVNIMTTSATVTLGGAILPVYTPSEKHSVGPVLSRITKSELYTTLWGYQGLYWVGERRPWWCAKFVSGLSS